jgi:hypothetical protein
MGGSFERYCVGRVYGADGTIRTLNTYAILLFEDFVEWLHGYKVFFSVDWLKD